jgi:hypothetical protein
VVTTVARSQPASASSSTSTARLCGTAPTVAHPPEQREAHGDLAPDHAGRASAHMCPRNMPCQYIFGSA